MNEQTSPTNAAPEVKVKKQRKPKTTTPRKPRVVDPVLAAIAAEAKEKRKAHKAALASAKRLDGIIKRCANLTWEHKHQLIDEISKNWPKDS